MTTAIDDKFVEDNAIVIGVDSRGDTLTSSVIAERLVAYDLTEMMRCAAHGDFEYIADKLSDGWRGYHRMSPGELWTEYKEIEESFLELYDTNELVVGLKTDDPLERAGANQSGKLEEPCGKTDSFMLGLPVLNNLLWQHIDITQLTARAQGQNLTFLQKIKQKPFYSSLRTKIPMKLTQQKEKESTQSKALAETPISTNKHIEPAEKWDDPCDDCTHWIGHI